MWETAQVGSSTFRSGCQNNGVPVKGGSIINTVFVNKRVNPINIVYSDNKPKNKEQKIHRLMHGDTKATHVIGTRVFFFLSGKRSQTT